MNKTHEICAKCQRYVALANPHVEAYTKDGLKVWLHIGFCKSYYEVPLVDIKYVNYYPYKDSVYGGGS